MNQTNQSKWIALSERVYRAMLILYPADYRRDYGGLMVQVFRDVCRDAYQKQGAVGILLWWCRTLLDLTLTVIEQRRKVRFTMSKATFVQLSGIFLIVGGALGAIAAFSQFQPDDHYVYYGIYQVLSLLLVPGFLFIGLGCIGLGMRYEGTLSRPGQWALYASSIGALVMAVGVIFGSSQAFYWNIWYGGGITHALALLAFGALHLRKPVLPVFRGLPLQMGGGWLLVALGGPNIFPQSTENLLLFFLFLGMGLAWLAIGLTVNRQQREAMLEAA